MKAVRIHRSLTLGMLLGCLVVASPGCGGGEDPAERPEVPADEAGGGGDTGDAVDATNLDVLHLCKKVSIKYEGGQSGAKMGNLYWANDVVWDGRSFTVDEQYVMDEGTDIEVARTVKIQGTISEDFQSLERAVVTIGGKGPKELQTYHEELTLVDLPISSMYTTIPVNWRDNPLCRYEAYPKRPEIANHLQGWSVKATDSAGEEWTTDQEMLVSNHLPFEDSSLTLEVFFSGE